MPPATIRATAARACRRTSVAATVGAALGGVFGISAIPASSVRAAPTVNAPNPPAPGPRPGGSKPNYDQGMTKPRPKPKPSPKPAPNNPTTPGPTLSEPQLQLDPAAARALRDPRVMGPSAVKRAAAKFGMAIDLGDVHQAIGLTVTQLRKAKAALDLIGARTVYATAGVDGVADVDTGRARLRNRADRPRETASHDETMRHTDPFHPRYYGHAVTVEGARAVVGFRSARNRDYLVSCRVYGTPRYGMLIERDGKFAGWHVVQIENGRITAPVPRTAKRESIRVTIVRAPYGQAGAPATATHAGTPHAPGSLPRFELSRCDIIPVE